MGLDLVIRHGTIVDGSGAARYRGDVGIKDGRIVEIGRIRATAQRTVDADGLIVAPGFIDGHTHTVCQGGVGLDLEWLLAGNGAATESSHGLRWICAGAGAGWLIARGLPAAVAAVEDIGTEAMLAGIDLPQGRWPSRSTCATVDRLPKVINYGAYLGHSVLRMYVMAKRVLNEKATDVDLARMVAAVKDAVRARRHGPFQLAVIVACHA